MEATNTEKKFLEEVIFAVFYKQGIINDVNNNQIFNTVVVVVVVVDVVDYVVVDRVSTTSSKTFSSAPAFPFSISS